MNQLNKKSILSLASIKIALIFALVLSVFLGLLLSQQTFALRSDTDIMKILPEYISNSSSSTKSKIIAIENNCKDTTNRLKNESASRTNSRQFGNIHSSFGSWVSWISAKGSPTTVDIKIPAGSTKEIKLQLNRVFLLALIQ